MKNRKNICLYCICEPICYIDTNYCDHIRRGNAANFLQDKMRQANKIANSNAASTYNSDKNVTTSKVVEVRRKSRVKIRLRLTHKSATHINVNRGRLLHSRATIHAVGTAEIFFASKVARNRLTHRPYKQSHERTQLLK